MLSRSTCLSYAPDSRLSGCRAVHSRRLPSAPRLRSPKTTGDAADHQPRTASSAFFSAGWRSTARTAITLKAPLPLVRFLTAVRALDLDALVGSDSPQYTALIAASFTSNNERIRGLLSLGAGPDVTSSKDMPRPLLIACCKGNTEAVEDLLRAGANPNFLPCDMNSPLEVACCTGHVEVVGALLRGGASPTAVGDMGMAPIGFMCAKLDHDVPGPVRAEIVDLLLQAGADPRAVYGPQAVESSRIEAVAVGDLRVASGGGASGRGASRGRRGRVGRKGASARKSYRTGLAAVNSRNSGGASGGRQRSVGGPRAIELAVQYGIAEVIPVLVAAGEDPGWAPADVSYEEVQAGAIPPLLIIAVVRGHVDVVQALVAAGADVDVKLGGMQGRHEGKLASGVEGGFGGSRGGGGGVGDGEWRASDGLTPLCVAVQQGQVDVVRVLVEAGADVRVHGTTLLRAACYEGMEEMEEVLLAAGAEWN